MPKVPWKSEAQRKWGNSPAGHEALGKREVSLRNKATKTPLPPRVGITAPPIQQPAAVRASAIRQPAKKSR